MAEPVWVLQANMRDQMLLAKLQQCLTARGLRFDTVHVMPFANVLPDISIGLDDHDTAVIVMGLLRVAAHPRWRPGIFFDDQQFRWSTLQEHWTTTMFSSDGQVMTLSDACQHLLQCGDAQFVRPDADSKSFDGGVFDASGLSQLAGELSAQESVVMATTRAIDAEWRCFVVGDQIVAASAAMAHWNPADVYALDLARCGDLIGIIEANCFAAARFYAANIDDVVAAVSEYTRSNPGRTPSSFYSLREIG